MVGILNKIWDIGQYLFEHKFEYKNYKSIKYKGWVGQTLGLNSVYIFLKKLEN